jgi:hypothetical protein
MNNDDISFLWIGAFRYYCGRRSYAVSAFCEMLIREWPSLPEHTRSIIKRDLEEEFIIDDRAREEGEFKTLGDDIDRSQWEEVRKLWA